MLPVLQLGGLAIPLPPLILLISLYVGLDVAQRQAARRGLDGEKIYSLGFSSLLAGLLAARLAFVLLNLDNYLAIRPAGRMLVAFITPLLGSENIPVGLGVGVALAAYTLRRDALDWRRALDAYAIGAALFVVGLWLAHFVSGDAYGLPTGLPWGIMLWGAKRHPTQLYNLVVAAGILALLWRIRPPGKRRKGQGWQAPYDGFVAHLFVTLSSLTVLLLEPLRANSRVVAGGFRVWQVGALLVLLAALVLFAYLAPPRAQSPRPA